MPQRPAATAVAVMAARMPISSWKAPVPERTASMAVPSFDRLRMTAFDRLSNCLELQVLVWSARELRLVRWR